MKRYFLLSLLAPFLATVAHAGSIQGKVSGVSGPSVVYVDAIPGKSFPAPEQHALIDQRNLSFNPSLTVVAQSTVQIGQRAAALLLERMEQPTLDARTEVLPTSLIVRESVGAAR